MNPNQQTTEPRMPQIDPVTFAALSTLDAFLARAPLTRQEHAEAAKSLQHIVQTLEMLQNERRKTGAGVCPPLTAQEFGAAETHSPGAGNGRVSAEAAEEIFRNSK